jgi:hypothetical protein
MLRAGGYTPATPLFTPAGARRARASSERFVDCEREARRRPGSDGGERLVEISCGGQVVGGELPIEALELAHRHVGPRRVRDVDCLEPFGGGAVRIPGGGAGQRQARPMHAARLRSRGQTRRASSNMAIALRGRSLSQQRASAATAAIASLCQNSGGTSGAQSRLRLRWQTPQRPAVLSRASMVPHRQ